ncbi:MAG: hydrogenase maturation protease [Actinomycetota bacterium]
MKILVAGVGSTLWGDDGFGVEVAHRLMEMQLPSEVRVVETGTGGIHLVQELTAGFDAAIVIDATDRGRPPGTVMVIHPEVDDVHDMDDDTKYAYLADMHYTKPDKALMLARALNVLPGKLILVGCQPQDPERYGKGLAEPVQAAVDVAVKEVLSLVDGLLKSNGQPESTQISAKPTDG